MLYYSFTDWRGTSGSQHFVGWANYVHVFTNETYRNVFKTAGYYLAAGVLQQIISLALAVLLSKPVKGNSIFKGIIFFPFIMNGVAVALTYRIFYQPDGAFDVLLNALGSGGWYGFGLVIPELLTGLWDMFFFGRMWDTAF